MALSNFAQLCETITRNCWGRTDLSGHIPDWITMTEAKLNNTLRVAWMEAVDDITLTDGVGDLPDDYLAYRAVYSQGAYPIRLEAAEPNWALSKYTDATATDPKYFYIAGSSIYTAPVSNSDLTLLYYQAIPPLADNSTNWLLTRAPQIYVYGAMLEAAPALDDGQRIQEWGTLFNDAVAQLTEADVTHRFNKIQSRVFGPTP